MSIGPIARFADCWNGGRHAGRDAFASGWVRVARGEIGGGGRIVGAFYCRAVLLREIAGLDEG
ncbi:hypothetical protein [Methylocapsa acidiphila]|uniref:hypothetical protein n=1 Tax=Methylocapsa acidiphila TaxID=133552 RepID=UPI00040C631C|nr:hypothetical protein [Methylocapsa acidiphila]